MHRGIKRSAASLALASAVAVAIAGCGSGTAAPDPTSSGAPQEDVTLSMWTFLDPNSPADPRGMALKNIVEEFNEQSDRITVEVRSVNYAQIDADVIKATASGTGPDIVNIYSNQLATHVAAGTVLPMTDYVTPFLEELGDDYIFPMEGATFDDQIMALPWETRAWLLWYRSDLLEAAGVDVPTTLKDLGTAGAAMQQTGVTGLAIGFSSQGLGADFTEKFIPLTIGNKGAILDEDGKAAFDTAAGVKTLNYLKSLYDQGAFGDEVLNMSADDVVNGVKAGTIAMAIEGSYRVAAARSGAGIGTNLKTMPIPSAVAGTPTDTPIAGQTLAIGANTKNADAAWEFIQYYLSPASQQKFAAAGVLPVLSSVYESDALKALPNYKELLTWRDYVLNNGTANPATATYNQLSDALVTAGQQVVFQGADPAEALKTAANTYNSSR